MGEPEIQEGSRSEGIISNAKVTIVQRAINIIQEEGKISLDDLVDKLKPKYADGEDSSKEELYGSRQSLKNNLSSTMNKYVLETTETDIDPADTRIPNNHGINFEWHDSDGRMKKKVFKHEH